MGKRNITKPAHRILIVVGKYSKLNQVKEGKIKFT